MSTTNNAVATRTDVAEILPLMEKAALAAKKSCRPLNFLFGRQRHLHLLTVAICFMRIEKMDHDRVYIDTPSFKFASRLLGTISDGNPYSTASLTSAALAELTKEMAQEMRRDMIA